MKCKTFLIVITILLIYGNDISLRCQTPISNLYNMTRPPFLIDIGDVNPLNNDNIIFKSKKAFNYSYIFMKGKEEYVCALRFDEKCRCIDWKLIKRSTATDEDKYIIENIKLYVFSKIDPQSSLSNSQTLIKYEYYNKQGRIFLGEMTGVYEDSTRIFLHQPRSHAFILTELSPFPDVRFPLFIGKKWEAIFSVTQNTLQLMKIPSLDKHQVISRNISYEVVKEVRVNTKLGKVKCYKIVSYSKGSSLNDTQMIGYFNSKLGFVKLEYMNIDDSILKLEMTSVQDNYDDSNF